MQSPAVTSLKLSCSTVYIFIFEQEYPVIKYANLAEAAIGPEGDDKLLPRLIPEGGALEELNPDEGSTDDTEP
jgi:hypothetical protein